MTKEELEKEAERCADEYRMSDDYSSAEPYDIGYANGLVIGFEKGFEKGAEPREKRIADLERKLEQTEKDLTDYQFNYPKIKDLEKENAELKKQVKQNRHLADVRLEQSLENYKLFSDERKERIDTDIALEDMTDNLTKAKEILQLFLKLKTIPCASGNSVNMLQFENICKQAEQFLKDCDIDNAIQQANKGLDFDKIADEMEQDLKDSEVEK